MYRFSFFSSLVLILSIVSGCSSDVNPFLTPSTVSGTSGVVSQKNFSLLTSDVNPGVIDGTTGVFTKTDLELTIYIGDRNNQTLTDAHTVHFIAEYGLIEPSCVTENGSCTVGWSAIKRPEFGGPASDGYVTITAYTTGEETFQDTNGNGFFDDGETFEDLDEPYVDADYSPVSGGFFNAGDIIIDVVSINDPTGINGIHDAADGFFNGTGCRHTSLCGTATSVAIYDFLVMNIVTNGPEFRAIGGTVSGLTGTGLVLQNNGGDDLSILADGAYNFATPLLDGETYAVTVSSQPTSPTQTCTVANATGTVSANVTNADVTCATNTYTIGGNVTGIPATETLIIQNNGGDDLSITADGAFAFTTPIADGSTYNVTILTNPATATCTVSGGTGTGTVSAANVTNVTIGCI